jgi:Ca-activated chloride channel homolog
MSKVRALILLFFLAAAPAASGQKLTRILFILDASNSMNAKWGQQTRIEAAKDLLAKAVDSLKGSSNLEIALRVYGHQSPITSTYQDCNDTRLEVPFARDNYSAVKTEIYNVIAKGTTPIARSLEAAASDFPDTLANNVIILITDGLEACDNDPCVIAKKLHDKGVKVTPFVIGLGLDISYLEQFRCIGSYSEAETREAFSKVLGNVIGKVLVRTTAQINLNNLQKQPVETDVTCFLYEAGTKNLKYTFEHTINRYGNPDTLVIDPNLRYDMVVNTIPKVEVKNISLKKNTHNIINADTPQGFIRPRFSNASRSYFMESRIMKSGSGATLNTQVVGNSEKYIVGSYDVEILSLPRLYRTVDVTQNSTCFIDIPAPGNFSWSAAKAVAAQIFVIREDRSREWVCNLDQTATSGNIELLPGAYIVVYRIKSLRSTAYTTEKEFRIISNKPTAIKL